MAELMGECGIQYTRAEIDRGSLGTDDVLLRPSPRVRLFLPPGL